MYSRQAHFFSYVQYLLFLSILLLLSACDNDSVSKTTKTNKAAHNISSNKAPLPATQSQANWQRIPKQKTLRIIVPYSSAHNESLQGIKIGVRKNTSFWETIQSLKKGLADNQQFDIIQLNDKITPDDKFDKLIYAELDAVIEDSNLLWKNKLMGFEYELIKHFAQQQKVNLKVLVAESTEQMFQWLEQGRGDIISAGLIKTAQRAKHPVSFTSTYLFVKQIIVQNKKDKAIRSTGEFNNRHFYVRKSSSYWNTLITLQEKLAKDNIHFTIHLVDETMESEDIIKKVIDGDYDLTLVASHLIDIEQSWNSHLLAPLALSNTQGHRWIIRKKNPKLLAILNNHIKKIQALFELYSKKFPLEA